MHPGPSPVPSRSARRTQARRSRPSHRAARVLLAVAVAALVVAVVWKVGSLRGEPAAAGPGASQAATTTLPSYAPGSTAGALAPDLPSTLAPVPDGATVLSSSAERTPDGDHVQFSLSLRTTTSPSKVVTLYTKAWKKHGFAAAPGASGTATAAMKGADAGATYRRAASTATASAGTKVGSTELTDYLQVAVVDEHGSSLVTVTGQVRAPAPSTAAAPSVGTATTGTD